MEIPFQSSLLLEERIWTRDFPDTPLAKAYDSLARRLSEAVPRVAPRALAFERGHGTQWLDRTEQPHLTLLGDDGTGKTWFTRRLAATLAHRWQDDPRRLDLCEVSKALHLDNILYDPCNAKLVAWWTRKP